MYVPKTNPVLNEISNLYKRNTFHILLYGFISGVQWSLPSLTKKEAAEMFLKRFSIAEGTLDTQTILTTYDRIHLDVIDAEREKR